MVASRRPAGSTSGRSSSACTTIQCCPDSPDLHLGFCDLLCVQNDIEAATNHLQQGEELGKYAPLRQTPYRLARARARLRQVHGDLDGALDLLSLGTTPLEAVAAVKCAAQWVGNGLPLAVLAPVVSIALGASPSLAGLTVLTALLGGLGFAFVGGIGASLALGARRGGVLVAVIVLPLFAPLVIFGAGSVSALAGGLDWRSGLLFLTRGRKPDHAPDDFLPTS